MKKKFIHDISSNSFQVIINQLCGLLIFYILSIHLGKNEFGEFNWTLAILLTVFNILSLGIDQVIIKKVAAGGEPSQMLSVYSVHVLISGIVFYSLLLINHFIFKDFFRQHHLLLLLGAGKLMNFFSTPFKQVAIGLERFRPLLVMTTFSNLIRGIGLIILASFFKFDLRHVIFIFIAGDFAELLLSFLMMTFFMKIPLSIRWNKSNHAAIIRESLPQAGVVIFTSGLARFDWIFIGLFASNIILAEYSFAYKVFEIATLPLLVLAPILIPRFTRIFNSANTDPTSSKLSDLFALLRIEMIIASATALILFICWVPVIDIITKGKYGMPNRYTILILSASLPFIYFNNFFWTMIFVRDRLNSIFKIIGISFLIILVADIVLIPFYGGEGAAVAYLIAMATQSALYTRNAVMSQKEENWSTLLICPCCALASGSIAMLLPGNIIVTLSIALILFAVGLFFSRQLKWNDRLIFKRVTGL